MLYLNSIFKIQVIKYTKKELRIKFVLTSIILVIK